MRKYSMYKEKHKFVIFLAKIFKMEHITFECAWSKCLLHNPGPKSHTFEFLFVFQIIFVDLEIEKSQNIVL